VVASPVGMNGDIVEDGRNGFLASSHEEWAAGLNRLYSNTNLGANLGARGREKILFTSDGAEVGLTFFEKI